MKNHHARISRSGDLFFAVLPGPWEKKIESVLHKIDHVLENSFVLKNTRTTAAALVALDDGGNLVFFKRTNNKGLSFTLRYLFRSARSFRAAMAGTKLREIGIDTPEILAVGERRKFNILRAGYLITSTRNDISNASKIIIETTDVPLAAYSFLDAAGPIAAKLHANRMIHGDLKLFNFFYLGNWTPDADYGLWDLDGARIFSSAVPKHLVLDELSRIVSSILILADQNPRADEPFFHPSELCERLLDSYSSEAPGLYLPSLAELTEKSIQKWQKNPLSKKKKHEAIE